MPQTSCDHRNYPNSRCLDCNEKSWQCNCGHPLYSWVHAFRKEPNSGILHHTGCMVPGCPCERGENRLHIGGVVY